MVVTPLAGGLGASIDRHAQAFARVVAAATEDQVVCEAAEVLDAHLNVGLEAAAGEHHAAVRFNIDQALRRGAAHAPDDELFIHEQVQRAGFVGDRAAEPFEAAEEQVNESGAARFWAAAVTSRMRVAGFPFEAHSGEPFRGFAGILTERTHQFRVGAAARNAHQVGVHLIDAVVARAELIGLVGEAHLGVSEARVAAPAFLRGFLNEDDIRAGLASADGGRQSGDAAADNDNGGLIAGGGAGGS